VCPILIFFFSTIFDSAMAPFLPLPVPHVSIDAWSRTPPYSSGRPGACTIRNEGYPTLKPPELAGPATPLPPQRPVRRPPALNLVAAKAMLQETLEKATSEPESPGTPHWGSSPALDCVQYRWCATPATDVEDDAGSVMSDNDNSSVMSFDGGSTVGSPALKEVIDTFMKPHSGNADSNSMTQSNQALQVEKKLSEAEGVESARSFTPTPTPPPEEQSNSVMHEQTPQTTLQDSADIERIESIRSALKRVAKTLGPDGAKDLLKLRKESLPQGEQIGELPEGLELSSNSEMISLAHCPSPAEADAQTQAQAPQKTSQDECDSPDSLPTEVPSTSDAESLPTEGPFTSDADSILTYSPSDSPTSAADSLGWGFQISDSDHSSSGAIARAVSKVAQARLGTVVSGDLARAAAALPSSHTSGKYGQSSEIQQKLMESRSRSVPLLAASCTALPEHACDDASPNQTASHPQTRLPTLAATRTRTSTPIVGMHLHSMMNSVRPSSELPLSEVARLRNRPVSPIRHPSKTDDASSATAGVSGVSSSSQQHCTKIMSRLDQFLEEVDTASASWLSAPPPPQRAAPHNTSAAEKSTEACGLKCPRGHALVPTGFRRAWICDGCEQRFEKELAEGQCCHRCATCDFDLCGPCATSAASSQKPVGMQVSPQCPRELHDRIALPLMKHTQTLGKAYSCLEEVNWLNICKHGVVMPAAVYNQACCLALGAKAFLQGVGELIEPRLPLHSRDSASSRDLVEQQLDLAVEMLNRAIQAGYLDVTNMLTDPDLKLLREHRSTEFNSAVQRVHAHANPGALVWKSIHS